MHSKVCLIGLDSAPPELVLDRWRKSLPNLDKLMSAGVYGALESTIPPITVPAWMSMFTGKDPGTLGIYGFRNRKDHTYENLGFANSRMVHEETVWDVLARYGKRSILLGIPLTYPPRPINGLMVCDFLAPSTEVEYTFPPELAAEIREQVGDYIIDVRQFRTEDKERLLGEITEMTRRRFALARYLVQHKPWDFFAMVEMGSDRIHHGFWRYFDPEHPLYEPGNPYEHAIRNYYILLDEEIGNLLPLLPQDTLVAVVSDHGAKRMDGGICINEWLIQEGYLTLKAPPEPRSKLTPEMVDWSRTKAWGDGGYYGRIFLNVKDREPQGIVENTEVVVLREELVRKLEALGDENGRPIGTRVYLPEDVYAVCNNIPPDLIVYFGNLHWRSVGSVGHGTIWIHENDTGPDDANHAHQGLAIFSAAGAPPQGAGERRHGMSIYDVAPTLLRALDIEPPVDMGRSPVPLTSLGGIYSEAEEEEIARRLEELGYL